MNSKAMPITLALCLCLGLLPQAARAQSDPFAQAMGILSQGGLDSSYVQRGAQLFEEGKKVADPLGEAFSEMGPLQQYQLGYEVAARILGAYPAVEPGHPAAQYLDRVGSTVALASNNPYPYNRRYVFILLDSAEINAFATPGGFVFVTTGMLKFVTSEEELAAILGHEVAHVELQHGIQSVGKENSIKLALAVKDVTATESGVGQVVADPKAMELVDQLAGQMMENIRAGYNVEMESAADRRSVAISKALGYDPLALARLLARFKQATHTYGGAKYPENREALARARAASLSGAAFRPNPARNQRFAQAASALK